MRFFLYGYYGQGNFGDDLLLRACVLGIRGICPNARFIVRAGTAATGLEPLLIPFERAEVDRALADQSRSKLARVLAVLAAYHNYLRGCDWFVFGGGTLFHERTSALPLVLLLLICLMARTTGIRIAALGVGIAELRSRTAFAALRGIILLSDVFAVRDETALEQCRKAGASQKVTLTGDLAFALPGVIGGGTSGVEVGRRVGISVYPPALEGGDGVTRNALLALQSTVSQLVASGTTLRLLAFHRPPQDAGICGDEATLAKLVADLPAPIRPVVERVGPADDALGPAFAGLDLFCGMRFHGHVLAAIHGVPFVGISADNKIDAICRLFGMPVLPAAGLNASDFLRAITTTFSRVPDREILDRCVSLAHRNFSLLANAVKCRSRSSRIERRCP